MFRHGLVIVISILTSFPQVWSQNCVLVDGKFNLTFNYNTPKTAVFWERNGASLFTAAVDTSSGSGCQGVNTNQGFAFYCEDAGSTYIMEITSKPGDQNDNFTTNPIVGSLVYTPIVDLNQCPKNVCECNQPGENIENFTFSCESTCTQNHFLKLQYQPESGKVEDLENPVKATIVKCHPDADLYNSTFSYIINSNHTVLHQFNSQTKRIKLIVKMIFGGTQEKEVFVTDFFFIGSTALSSTVSYSTTKPSVTADVSDTTITSSTTGSTTDACPECRWCLPVLISCAVVIITGIITAILRYVKWDESKDWKLYCCYFWFVLLVICLIILIIYVAVIELDCCDKETCNGFAIAEIVIDVLVILVYIFSLKKQCTKKEENPSSDVSLKPKP